MARFPKKLILVAAVAELLILATAGRSEVISAKPAQLGLNAISTLPTLPKASGIAHHAIASAGLEDERATNNPQHVI